MGTVQTDDFEISRLVVDYKMLLRFQGKLCNDFGPNFPVGTMEAKVFDCSMEFGDRLGPDALDFERVTGLTREKHLAGSVLCNSLGLSTLEALPEQREGSFCRPLLLDVPKHFQQISSTVKQRNCQEHLSFVTVSRLQLLAATSCSHARRFVPSC